MTRRLVPLVLLLLLSACATRHGPELAQRDRHHYNDMVRMSEDEQLLMNIVRLRYNDTPRFLDLSSVVVQYGREAQGSAGVGFGVTRFLGSAPPAAGGGSVAAGASWSEKPTLSYQPLQGEAYARRLLTAVPVEVIWLLANSGWSIERLMLLTVERARHLENASIASGPHPLHAPEWEAFRELTATARRLQRQRVLVLAAQTRELGGQQLTLNLYPERAPELAGDVRRLQQLLGLPEDATQIALNVALDQPLGAVAPMRTRSMLGTLYFVANTIRPPQEHISNGMARVARNSDGSIFDWSGISRDLIDIRHAVKQPEHAYVAVSYRDHWFYIDDRDADSKASFSLLQLLYSLQASGSEGRAPLLTLPAG